MSRIDTGSAADEVLAAYRGGKTLQAPGHRREDLIIDICDTTRPRKECRHDAGSPVTEQPRSALLAAARDWR
jgi:hypothetical protein